MISHSETLCIKPPAHPSRKNGKDKEKKRQIVRKELAHKIMINVINLHGNSTAAVNED